MSQQFSHVSILFILLSCCQQSGEMIYDENVIICPIEDSAEFPGGVEGLNQYLKEHNKWAQKQLTVAGTVFVGFLVNENGAVSQVEIVRGLCESCDEEAARLIRCMPKWKPARALDGNSEKRKVIVPVRFGQANRANSFDSGHVARKSGMNKH